MTLRAAHQETSHLVVKVAAPPRGVRLDRDAWRLRDTAVEPAAPIVAQAPVAAEPALTQATAHDRLFELFKASDKAKLQRNPLSALSRGDLRYADQMGDYISDDYLAAQSIRSGLPLTWLPRLGSEKVEV